MDGMPEVDGFFLLNIRESDQAHWPETGQPGRFVVRFADNRPRQGF